MFSEQTGVNWKLVLLFLFTAFTTTTGYKILAFHAFASQSHLNAFVPVVNELAERGHDVTMIQPYPELKVHSNIKLINSFDMIEEEDGNSLFQQGGMTPYMVEFMIGFTFYEEVVCREMLSSESVQALLKQGKQFDIVIVNYILCECGFAISSLLGNYTVYYSAGFIPHFYPSPAPQPYSTIPNHMVALPSRMTFMQRLANAANFITVDLMYEHLLLRKANNIVRELVPEAPSIQTAMSKISLYITNIDPVIGIPRPSVPSIVSLCCPHCRDSKPLPEEFEKFIATSGEDGFIMFGLGSHAQSRFMPEAVKKAFVNAFAKLKQKVIWKFEDDSLKPPPNVHLTKWMPQQDLLGHPKLRLFITHGGLLSLQEAVYNGVPVIGVPVFADQPGNVEYLVEKGIAGRLLLNNITTDGVYQEIMKILNDPSYAEKMRKNAVLFRAHNKGTVSKGADWIEYVAQHDGAWHLRTLGQDMNVIQYFLIDVILVVTAVALLCVVLLVSVIQLILGILKVKKIKKS